jgi:hypothetical protein
MKKAVAGGKKGSPSKKPVKKTGKKWNASPREKPVILRRMGRSEGGGSKKWEKEKREEVNKWSGRKLILSEAEENWAGEERLFARLF